jgi:hypothetical protein
MAKAGKRKVKQAPPRKVRDPRHGDSTVGLPGVMDIESDRDYLAAYRYSSGLAQLHGRQPQQQQAAPAVTGPPC